MESGFQNTDSGQGGHDARLLSRQPLDKWVWRLLRQTDFIEKPGPARLLLLIDIGK